MLVAITGCGLCYTLRGIDKKFREVNKCYYNNIYYSK